MQTVSDSSAQPIGSLFIEYQQEYGVDDVAWGPAQELYWDGEPDPAPDAVWASLNERADGAKWRATVHVITGDDSSRQWLRCTTDGWSL